MIGPRFVRRALRLGRKQQGEDYLVQECVQLLLAENARLRAYRDSLRPKWLSRRAKGVVIEIVCGLMLGAVIVGGSAYASGNFDVDAFVRGWRDGQAAAMGSEDAAVLPAVKLAAPRGERGGPRATPAPARRSQ